ncbi:3,9-dihydroxypterocarpan 6A-monooxygenase-like [Aristolochia californica]|uniref:3,9-dihydroxypterocarpan 6A-monooxygenase-like n=1 Tax=Aristolochia californica TaxID=171875 RepID=UPI0035DBDE06
MEFSFTFCVLLSLLAYLLTRSLLRRRYPLNPATPLRNLPSPPALPVIGHLYLLGPLMHRSLHRLSKRYGSLFHLCLGSLGSVVVASSPSMAEEFLKTHELNFTSRPGVSGSEYSGDETGGFTLSPYGPYWKFLKKLSVTLLFSNKMLQKTIGVRREELRAFLDSLYDKSRAGEPADLGLALTALSNNVISRMLMSERCSGSANEAEECRKAVDEILEMTWKLNTLTIWHHFWGLDIFGYRKRLKVVHRTYRTLMERIMDDHESKEKKREMGGSEEYEKEDIMDILLRVSKDDEAEVKLNRDNIRVFITDIFTAGTETSSKALLWALAELINHPPIFQKAREEIESVVGNNRLVEESDIPNLPYLQAIVKETLRIHPVAPVIIRECSQDCRVMDVDIPKGTKLFVNVWAIGRDAACWEDPLKFMPERFLKENPLDIRGQHFQLLPFGRGRRMCLGFPLAIPVIQGTLAALIQCFDWKPVGQPDPTKIAMEEKDGFTVSLAHPLYCIPVPHLKPMDSA